MAENKKFSSYDRELMRHWFKVGVGAEEMIGYFQYKQPAITEEDVKKELEDIFETKDLQDARRKMLQYQYNCTDAFETLSEVLEVMPFKQDGKYYIEYKTPDGTACMRIRRDEYVSISQVLDIPAAAEAIGDEEEGL